MTYQDLLDLYGVEVVVKPNPDPNLVTFKWKPLSESLLKDGPIHPDIVTLATTRGAVVRALFPYTIAKMKDDYTITCFKLLSTETRDQAYLLNWDVAKELDEHITQRKEYFSDANQALRNAAVQRTPAQIQETTVAMSRKRSIWDKIKYFFRTKYYQWKYKSTVVEENT